MLLSRNWKETQRLFGPQARTAGSGNDQRPDGLTGAQLAVVTGAAHLGDEGQDQAPGGKA